MIEILKPIKQLTPDDMAMNPLWEYTNRDGADETFVRAVKDLPVETLSGRVVATQLRLANGSRVWGLIGNIDVKNPRSTEHFRTVSIQQHGRWFDLARYHDFDFADRGPAALSQFLGLGLEDVFPISFDAREIAVGAPAVLAGSVEQEPHEKLTSAELMAMAFL